MNEHGAPGANRNTFDGDAISRADREFLASLGDHPLVRHPLYSVPHPPRPNYAGCTTIVERQTAQEMCFQAALDWMLVNYAYYVALKRRILRNTRRRIVPTKCGRCGPRKR